MKIEMSSSTIINTNFFCNTCAKTGTVVEYIEDHILEQQGIYTIKPGQNGGNIIGILLNDIVNIDMWNYRCFSPYRIDDKYKQVGSKVQILQNGVIMLKAKQKREVGTLLYYNKKGILTQKKQLDQKPIGAILQSDNDGWTKILFKWCGL